MAISDQKTKWIEIAINETVETVSISVVDSGNGIPHAIAKFLFEPFFTTKKSGEGSGIGLSISRSLAQANQGSLWYDAKHANTRFVLEIQKKMMLRARERF